MPIELERKLQAQASKKGLFGKRANVYVYGTMRKTGWKPEKKSLAQSMINRGHK